VAASNASNADTEPENTESGGAAARVKVIRLSRKQTVSDLATAYYGTSDKATVQLILSQNPKIRHAYQVLAAGTRVIVPLRPEAGALDEQTNDERLTQTQKQGSIAVPTVGRKYGTVRVQRDETLFQFAMEELGKGDWATVRKIRLLIRRFASFRFSQKGQWIKLPRRLHNARKSCGRGGHSLQIRGSAMKAILCLISMTLALIAASGALAQSQQAQQSQRSQQSEQSQQSQQSQQPYPGSAAAAAKPPATSQPATSQNDGSRPELHQRYPRYRIGANDVMDLTFRYTPEFNQEVMVQPDGYVQLRGLPADVHAQGLTVVQFTDELQKQYSKILHDPVINIVLKDFDKPYFIAGGFVGKPGKYDLRGTTTASQAVAIAGGFSDGAKNSQVVLFRRYSDEWVEAKVLNLLTRSKADEDMLLQPGAGTFSKSTLQDRKFLPRPSRGFSTPVP
jgi:polysaccharide export outer membrane protein